MILKVSVVSEMLKYVASDSYVSELLHHILRGWNEQRAHFFLSVSCRGHRSSSWTCHCAPIDFINSFFTLQWHRDHGSNSRCVTTLRSAATHSCAATSAEPGRLWRCAWRTPCLHNVAWAATVPGREEVRASAPAGTTANVPFSRTATTSWPVVCLCWNFWSHWKFVSRAEMQQRTEAQRWQNDGTDGRQS